MNDGLTVWADLRVEYIIIIFKKTLTFPKITNIFPEVATIAILPLFKYLPLKSDASSHISLTTLSVVGWGPFISTSDLRFFALLLVV